MKVLVCPLDWGIGHATRCVPVINKYLEFGDEVIIAADGRPFEFLKIEFPQCRFIRLKGATITYPKRKGFLIKFFARSPFLLWSYFRERRDIRKIIRSENPSIIVSDNRYGLWDQQVYSIILTHQLNMIYPSQNKRLAEKMTKNGGLLTEYISDTNPDRENFPKRNRIIAGICDAILVVEAAEKGGALITAEIGNSYNRDVFAIPGRINDPYSKGTNRLIRKNMAALVESAEDIRYLMGWEEQGKKPDGFQKKIFLEMTTDEKVLVEYLNLNGPSGIDDICINCKLSMGTTSAALLNLEFEGIVKSSIGKIYSLA